MDIGRTDPVIVEFPLRGEGWFAVTSPADRVPSHGTDRRRVHPVREAARALHAARSFAVDRLPSVLGDHVSARRGPIFAGFAHLAPGSIAVSEGQAMRTGDVIGRVGHTGDSTTSHLHSRLMDAADPATARAIPCAFRSYELHRGDRCLTVENGIPGRADRIRFLGP